jgi:regulator of replication initiation timing
MPKVAARGIELEPIDRLEEKVKLLVAMVDRMKAEQARAAEEHQRLTMEHEAMRARLAATEAMAADLAALQSERDAIRSRVTDMLEQLEALNL